MKPPPSPSNSSPPDPTQWVPHDHLAQRGSRGDGLPDPSGASLPAPAQRSHPKASATKSARKPVNSLHSYQVPYLQHLIETLAKNISKFACQAPKAPISPLTTMTSTSYRFLKDAILVSPILYNRSSRRINPRPAKPPARPQAGPISFSFKYLPVNIVFFKYLQNTGSPCTAFLVRKSFVSEGVGPQVVCIDNFSRKSFFY
jgi:hypothetical protein